ncbi:MAG: 23S rRNA (guanosine(2251)-2'-O)-methyltransferase RlmB [Ignavibacteriaceae bacterium]|nr:23S rRNA (guanosine(2251)-2'-O)-methyltransferase RlmB [Ignavibacteriaceae bacterium]
MKQIVGRKPVLEALNSRDDISQVYIQYGQQGGIINAIRIAAKKRGIKVNEIPQQKFKSFTEHKNPQGIIALISDQKFFSLEQIISSSKKEKKPLLLVLDSIQDTHNLGAILRTAECSGVDGIILTKHNSAPINETVIKTSTGATEHLMICLVNNLVNALKQLKESGFWLAGSSLENAKEYTEADYNLPLVLVLGNEEKGIRRLTAEQCDFLVKIPMKGKIQSLNVSVASGILLFEINRQRSLIK